MPSPGLPAALSMVLTASAPLSPSNPRIALVTSCCTPSLSSTSVAMEMTTMMSGPIEKME